MQTDIHFIPSYVCLRNFFTVFNSKNKNIIFTYENKDLTVLLNEILGKYDVVIISISKVSVSEFNILLPTYYLDNIYSKYFSNLSNFGNIFFYCDRLTYEFFFLINYLEKKIRINTVFINSEPFQSYSSAKGLINKLKVIKISILNIFLPIKLCYVNSNNEAGYNWIHNYNSTPIKALSWSALCETLYIEKICYNNNMGKSVIYIQQDISNFRFINYNKTRDNLIHLLNKYCDNGYKVFIKPHPANQEDINYHKSIRNVTVIPDYIPVELIDPCFSIYITYFSLGIKPFLPYECYSLYNFIEFKNDYDGEAEKLKMFIIKELDNIKFLGKSAT